MKLNEYNAVMYALENCERRERVYCKRHCALNPQDRDRRERDRDLAMAVIMMVRYEIERQVKKYVEEEERL